MLKSRITAAKEKKVDLVLKITSVTDESPSKNGVDSCVDRCTCQRGDATRWKSKAGREREAKGSIFDL